jgi:sugar lactone lactonase YvrE
VANSNPTANVNSITEYAPGADGNVPPIATISGSNTGLDFPAGLALGRRGFLLVANAEANSITVYPPHASGNVTPAATLSGPNTALNHPSGLALAPNGDVLVANGSNGAAPAITEYGPAAHGNSAPIATISGSNTGLDFPDGLALAPNGDLFVANSGNGTITEYAPGANGNAAPIATITTNAGSPAALARNPRGDLFVTATPSTVLEYAPGANGNAAPIATISGSNTGLSNDFGGALGPSEVLFVTNTATSSVTEYGPGADGNVAPIATISGFNTGLDAPDAITVAPGVSPVRFPFPPIVPRTGAP